MKKSLFLILLLCMATGSLPLIAQDLGDVNTDGAVDIIDALLIAQYYVGLNPDQFDSGYADVNCSGGIDIVDGLLVAQYYVGLISTFPCDNPTAVPTTAPTPVSGDTLYFDDFDDGNADGWEEDRGTWSVVEDSGSYVYYQSSSDEGRTASGDQSWTDYTVTADMKVTAFNGTNRAFLCGRYQDGNNYYAASLYNSGDGKLEIRRKVSGSSTTLVDKEYTLSEGVWYSVSLELSGSSLSMYVNGTLELTASDSSISSGGIGLVPYKAAVMHDNITVTGSGTVVTQPPTTTDESTPTPTTAPDVTPGPTADPGSIDFSMIGFATLDGGTTGGEGGTTVTVSTGTALQDAIDLGGPRIIYINGTITPDNSDDLTKIDIKDVSDISLIGVGTSGELNGIGIKIWRASNVIIRNLCIHHVDIGDKDCIGIEGPSDHVWIDHCELYNDLIQDKDYYDGLLDAKADSEYITYSWNYLHDSYKTCLVGSSDDDDYDRKITFHHNWYDNCYSRLPLYRFGTGHIFNCYYSGIIDTGINSRMGAVLRVENTVFEDSKDPLGFWYSEETGYWDVYDLLYINCTGSQPTTSTGSFSPSYSYSLHSTDQVKSIVQQYAGVGKI